MRCRTLSAAGAETRTAGRRILLIEDEKPVRQTLRRVLEQAGYQVTEASDGDRGLLALRAQPADLVITDILMPNKEGIETIIEMRERWPDLPVIAISGGGRARIMDFLRFAKTLGARHTLQKPFRRSELLAAVRDCLGENGAGSVEVPSDGGRRASAPLASAGMGPRAGTGPRAGGRPPESEEESS